MLRGVVCSIIQESKDGETISEQFTVELFDVDRPNSFMGGIGGIRSALEVDADDDGMIPHSAWTVGYLCEFDETQETDEGGDLERDIVLSKLDDLATKLLGVEVTGGKTFESLRSYFERLDAPYQTLGTTYPLSTNEEVLKFRQMLNRKFGEDLQLSIEGRLFDVMELRGLSSSFSKFKAKRRKRKSVIPTNESPNYGAWSTW
jgi:hypothetical protein